MTEAIITYRLRITFGKEGTLRFVGHLDLAKTWERVFRRAHLPLVYSQGFNPQPKMQFAAALPVGISSDSELLDLWLTEPVDIGSVPGRLNAVSPQGLMALNVVEVPAKAPALQTLVQSADYRFVVSGLGDASIRQRIEDLLAQPQLERARREKAYDLRPLILALEAEGEGRFFARLALGEVGTGRPDELLDALSLSWREVQCHRLRIHLSELPEARHE